MIPVRLHWSPSFETGQKLRLDSLFVNTVVPAVPPKDQAFSILAHYREGQTWQDTADYFNFVVESIHYYWEGSSELPWIEISLTINITGRDVDFEKEVAEALIHVYGWKADD